MDSCDTYLIIRTSRFCTGYFCYLFCLPCLHFRKEAGVAATLLRTEHDIREHNLSHVWPANRSSCQNFCVTALAAQGSRHAIGAASFHPLTARRCRAGHLAAEVDGRPHEQLGRPPTIDCRSQFKDGREIITLVVNIVLRQIYPYDKVFRG